MDFKFLADEVAIIMAAPALSIGLILTGAVAAWFATRAIVAGRVDALTERLKLANDREANASQNLDRATNEIRALTDALVRQQRALEQQPQIVLSVQGIATTTASNVQSSAIVANYLSRAVDALKQGT